MWMLNKVEHVRYRSLLLFYLSGLGPSVTDVYSTFGICTPDNALDNGNRFPYREK